MANEVGHAIQDSLANTPELRRYLRLIPIAGSLIESQLQHIGQSVGENVVYALNARLLDEARIDELIVSIASSLAHVRIDSPALEALITKMITDGLSEFEAQVKVQQWKHQDMLNL